MESDLVAVRSTVLYTFVYKTIKFKTYSKLQYKFPVTETLPYGIQFSWVQTVNEMTNKCSDECTCPPKQSYWLVQRCFSSDNNARSWLQLFEQNFALVFPSQNINAEKLSYNIQLCFFFHVNYSISSELY